MAGRLVRRRDVVQRRAVRPRPRAGADRGCARGCERTAGLPSASGGLPPATSSSPFSPRSAPAASAAISSRRPIRSRMRSEARVSRCSRRAMSRLRSRWPTTRRSRRRSTRGRHRAGLRLDRVDGFGDGSVDGGGRAVPRGRRHVPLRQPAAVLDPAEDDGERGDRSAASGPRGSTSRTSGSGIRASPPVLLVMGLGTQMLGWPDGFCEALAGRGVHVIRFDNRDIGLSSHLTDAPTPDVRGGAARRSPRPRPTGSRTWPPTWSGCSTRSGWTARTSSARRWAG